MKRLVQKESRKMSLFSIPLGIAGGCIIGYLILPGGWYWPNTVRFAVLTAFVMAVTVHLSIRRPVQIAMSVSPVEAVRITTASDVTKIGETKKLADIDRQAQERFYRLIEGMQQTQGITERLKEENALEWTVRMNNIRACAREIVNEEIIYA